MYTEGETEKLTGLKNLTNAFSLQVSTYVSIKLVTRNQLVFIFHLLLVVKPYIILCIDFLDLFCVNQDYIFDLKAEFPIVITTTAKITTEIARPAF